MNDLLLGHMHTRMWKEEIYIYIFKYNTIGGLISHTCVQLYIGYTHIYLHIRHLLLHALIYSKPVVSANFQHLLFATIYARLYIGHTYVCICYIHI